MRKRKGLQMQILTTTLNKQQLNQIIQLNKTCALDSNDNYSYEPFYEYSENKDDSTGYYVLVYDTSDASQLIGFLSALVLDHEAELTGIVHPDFRIQGLFSKMTNTMIDKLKEDRYSNIYASIPDTVHSTSFSQCSLLKDISHTEYLLIFHKNLLDKSNVENSSDIQLPENLKITHKLSDSQNAADSYNLHIKCTTPSRRLQWRSVSSCRLQEESSFTNLWDVQTKKPYRSKGYGFQLIHYVLSDYFKFNDKPLILNVSHQNVAAFALYQKCGFEVKDKIIYYSLI